MAGPIIEPAPQPAVGGHGDQQAAPVAQDPVVLAQRDLVVIEVLEHVGADHHVSAGVGKGQLLGQGGEGGERGPGGGCGRAGRVSRAGRPWRRGFCLEESLSVA